jgi:tetratricopeptide (TPR) repeat protein
MVISLAQQAGWDQQCWQLAARCHDTLVAEGALAEAAQIAVVGLAAAERCADPHGIAVMHLASGGVAKMSGRLDAAMTHYDHAAPLFELLGDVRGQAKVALSRGAVHIARRELQAARDCQLAVLTTAGVSPVFTALATGNLGRIAICDGEFAEAIRCGTAALRIIDGAGIPAIRQVMEVHHDLADAHMAMGDLRAAREHVSTALSAAGATEQDLTFASVHVAVHLIDGQLALAEERPDAALQAFTRALAVRSGSTAHLANLLEGITVGRR